MEKENEEVKFVIEGNPGTGNTFVTMGPVENYNPHATVVNNTITTNNYYGKHKEVVEDSSASAKPGDKKLGNMKFRDLLKDGYINTGSVQKEIMNYVSCIRPYVKDEKDKLYMYLWAHILKHEAFMIDLYDPGKQDCKFNRNLVGNIIHYLEGKGFFKEPYNQSKMARAVEGSADSGVRGRGFGGFLDKKYSDVVDALLKERERK